MDKKLNVALVGLGFGGAFAEIYKAHPRVGELTLCDTNPELLRKTYDYIGGARTAQSLDEVLADPSIDAVHLVTPIPLHAHQSVAVLEAGKHCACTVPMATSLDDIRRIMKAKRISGKNYMMMETTLYTYQFRYVQRMKEGGRARQNPVFARLALSGYDGVAGLLDGLATDVVRHACDCPDGSPVRLAHLPGQCIRFGNDG